MELRKRSRMRCPHAIALIREIRLFVDCAAALVAKRDEAASILDGRFWKG